MTNIDTLNPSYNASLLATFLNPIFTGGTLALDQPGATYNQAFTLNNSTTNTIDQTGHAATFTGVFSDATTGGNLTIANSGVGGSVTFAAANTYTGSTTINSGATLNLSGAGSIAASSRLVDNGTFDISATASGASLKSLDGTGTVTLGNKTLTLTNASGTFGGSIAGNGGLAITGGAETLSGASNYNGPTNINGGTLIVNGSITSAANVASGMLSGTGSVGNTIVNSGGVLAPGSATPGTSLTIAGSLAFASGATYLVTLNQTTATFANVTGNATLAGTVLPVLSSVAFKKQYDILHSAGLNGTTFSGLSSAAFGSQVSGTLSYSATDVFLNLTAQLGAGGGLSNNQQNVASSINNFFNSGGTLSPTFTPLFGLSGAALGAALNQLTGETGTASQQTTFQAMTQFMGLLTDPFMGRGNSVNAMTGAPGYADEGASAYAATKRNAAERDAYAMFAKARPAPFVERWDVWASGFGGTQTTDGNAIVGSNSTTSSVFGTAVGADYLFSPNTLAGFALAGGGTGFNVTGSGWGRSDLFQAGAYLRHNDGPAYISAALAYGWQDITTNRIVKVAGLDRLQAEFNANAYSGRLEGGYRFVAPWNGGFGITPYAAAQFTTFDLPAYAETAIQGSGAFGLAYAAKTATDTRSEFGLRTDKSFAVQNGVLTLRGRLAWAHDFSTDRSIAPTFQSLPGASFVVNGAMQAADSALTTASAEMKWMNGWSAGATFEGEFSNVTRSYGGKGVVRYQW
ncbi:autotransporter domain-containing protein [Bradyrhizobium ganzhouense]|uniref:autotransporter family protein n=1 Tax=Bradyrhizobium ganzhouense TaxID=1179767 RepID=UPI003CEBAB9A